jgi:hypothetical protein
LGLSSAGLAGPSDEHLDRRQDAGIDSPWSLLRFAALPLLDRIRLGAAVAYLKLEPNYHRLEQMTADAWLRKWMGPRVYQVLWEPLLQSKFGDRYREIAMPWFWARMHYRSQSLGYLRGGFQQLYDALVAEIRRLGGEARFGTAVTGLHLSRMGFGSPSRAAKRSSTAWYQPCRRSSVHGLFPRWQARSLNDTAASTRMAPTARCSRSTGSSPTCTG